MTTSDLRKHASQDFETKVFFVPQPVGAPLDDSDLVLSPSTKPNEIFSSAVQYAAIPSQLRSTNEELQSQMNIF